MDLTHLAKVSDTEWRIEPEGSMRVPGVVFGDEALLREMDEKVREQVSNVASLPGIVESSYAMPDAHWGYGFPIGGVAAFDPEAGGVISAGGVGFDISCGVRTMLTGLKRDEFMPLREKIADGLFRKVPSGVGSTGRIRLLGAEMDAMLTGGARWAVEQGYGVPADLDRIESRGCVPAADPAHVSPEARKRQEHEMGTLGSGNHYLEIQEVRDVFDATAAKAYGIAKGDIVVSIHCGSRGLGHQIATEFSRRMISAAGRHGIKLADRELACAPIASPDGETYLGAMRSAINCALANRQIIMHLVRQVLRPITGNEDMPLLYDVSHNTCREETHESGGRARRLFVHRKGATCALPAGHPDVPEGLRAAGQPVLIGGTMGTSSYILAGVAQGPGKAFASACHGAGRQMSRTQATKQWQGEDVVSDLARSGILIRCKSFRGVAEEAPGAYKDVSAVVEATHAAGLARKVARLVPLACVKG